MKNTDFGITNAACSILLRRTGLSLPRQALATISIKLFAPEHGGFQKLGALLGSTSTKDPGIFGSMLGPLISGNPHMLSCYVLLAASGTGRN